jgi:hypothetical protein
MPLAEQQRHTRIRWLLDLVIPILDYRDGDVQAMQEVIADIYDQFIASERRIGIRPPDGGIIPALSNDDARSDSCF